MTEPRADFIVIGAMKCATSLLYEQLHRQPGVFLSTPKEPNFFSDEEQWSRGWPWYASLFNDAKPGDLRGECSTHYTKLPTHPDSAHRIASKLPNARLVYVMRHPIERLISHYIHEWTQGVIREPIDAAVANHPELIAYSRYAMQLEPYRQGFGPSSVLPVFYERLVAQPQQELERVCRFIGLTSEPIWRDNLGRVNASRERIRTSRLRSAILAAPGVSALKRLAPAALKDRINDFWRLRHRPEPSPRTLKTLTDVFDEDLGKLGAWLGMDSSLTCDTFKTIVTERSLEWGVSHEVNA